MGQGLRSLLLAVVLCGCWPESPANLGADQVVMGTDMVHPNGLVAAAPEGFEARPTETGFAFAEMAMVRSPLTFSLDLAAEPPAMHGARHLVVGGARVAYVVGSIHNPGSGGDPRVLIAAQPVGGHHVVLEADLPGETGSFTPAWAALERATVE